MNSPPAVSATAAKRIINALFILSSYQNRVQLVMRMTSGMVRVIFQGNQIT